MGFFSDLKEDLSQAVNEMLPEEAAEQEAETAFEEAPSDGFVSSDDLSNMLDNLDNMDMFDTETVSEAPAEEEQAFVSEPETSYEPELIAEPEPIPEPVYEEPVMEVTTEAEQSKGAFKKMDTDNRRELLDETAVITGGMQICGDISSQGSMEILGSVNGNIDILGKLNVTGSIQGDSKAAEFYAEGARITGEVRSLGSIKIGQSTVIIGNVFANSAVIAGAVKGDIDVHGPVILDTSAIVMGNIKSKSVQINNGAVIEGMCSQCYAEVNPTSFFEEIKKRK